MFPDAAPRIPAHIVIDERRVGRYTLRNVLDSQRLHELFAILREIHTIHQPDELWRSVLERSCATLQAEGGSFFQVLDEQRMVLTAAVGVNEEKLRHVPMRVGSGICGWVAEHQQTAVIDDTRSDNRFNPIADQVTGMMTRSVLCIPVFSQRQTYGVLELINGFGGRFSPEDQEFMTVLGQQTAVAYQNLLLIHETNQTKTLLESLLLNMSGGLIAMNAQGAITLLNPSARQLLQLSSLDGIGKPAAAVLMDYPIVLKLLHQTLKSRQTVSRQEMPLVVQSTSALFGYSTILISDPKQETLGSGIIFQKLS